MAGILPTLPGFLAIVCVIPSVHPVFSTLYDLAWFVGVAISAAVYCVLMKGAPGSASEGLQPKLA